MSIPLIELTVAPLLIAFSLVALGGAALLPLLHRFQLKQQAYVDAPATHQAKGGTPTMGGVLFIIALLPMLSSWRAPYVAEIFLLVLACGAIGFVDDYLAIARGRNLGLRARTKFLLTALIAIAFLYAASQANGYFPHDTIFQAGAFVLHVPHWLWLGLGILAITGTIHAVNLTDGLDGLATGTMLPPLALVAAIGFSLGLSAPTEAALLGVGACCGFLLYNRHPAKIFMGDTGSLALGALLSGIAILEGQMLLLIVIGGVFVAEALSVVLQVTYFKATGGKRIFRMSPLHHHFELGGWPETKVTARFWIVSFVLAVIAWGIVR